MKITLFKKHAEKLFLKENPTAIIHGWVDIPRWIDYPTGLRGMKGRFYATAVGYKPSMVNADWDSSTGWIIQ